MISKYLKAGFNMKKSLMSLGIMLLSVGILGGCTSQAKSSSNDSQQVALADNLTVSLKQAISIYQKTYPKTDIISIDLEKSLNKKIYRVEGVDDYKEYQININAANQKISHKREENLESDDRNGAKRVDKINLQNLLSIKKIAQIAEKELNNSKATEFSLEQEVGVTYWEVTVKSGLKEKEVKIDAQKGTVLKVDTD